MQLWVFRPKDNCGELPRRVKPLNLGWFRLAVQMGQNQAANDAFHAQFPTPTLTPMSPCDTSPAPTEAKMGKAHGLQACDPLIRARSKVHHSPNPPEDHRHHGESLH